MGIEIRLELFKKLPNFLETSLFVVAFPLMRQFSRFRPRPTQKTQSLSAAGPGHITSCEPDKHSAQYVLLSVGAG